MLACTFPSKWCFFLSMIHCPNEKAHGVSDAWSALKDMLSQGPGSALIQFPLIGALLTIYSISSTSPWPWVDILSLNLVVAT